METKRNQLKKIRRVVRLMQVALPAVAMVCIWSANTVFFKDLAFIDLSGHDFSAMPATHAATAPGIVQLNIVPALAQTQAAITAITDELIRIREIPTADNLASGLLPMQSAGVMIVFAMLTAGLLSASVLQTITRSARGVVPGSDRAKPLSPETFASFPEKIAGRTRPVDLTASPYHKGTVPAANLPMVVAPADPAMQEQSGSAPVQDDDYQDFSLFIKLIVTERYSPSSATNPRRAV